MNLYQNALEFNTNIQNNSLILRILETNILWPEVGRYFPNLCKLKVKTIFFDNIGRQLFFVNYASQFFLNKLITVLILRNLILIFYKPLKNLNILGEVNYF